MDNSWITSPQGRRVLQHWTDARPTWLWSADGQALIWRNPAARFFGRKPRKRDVTEGSEAIPLRGQVQRLIRLGVPNHASLSRMQFLIGARPVSATCSCMPVKLADGETGLLVVDVDPISAEHVAALTVRDPVTESLVPAGADYLLLADGVIAGGSPRAIDLHRAGPSSEHPTFRLSAGLNTELLIYMPEIAEAPVEPVIPEIAPPFAEPLLPIGLSPIEPPAPLGKPEAIDDEPWVEPLKPSPNGGLTSLFDRLADDGALFAPIRPEDEPVLAEPEQQPTQADAPEAELESSAEPALYRVVGKGFVPSVSDEATREPKAPAPAEEDPQAAAPVPTELSQITDAQETDEPSPVEIAGSPPDAESVERVSRYNFDELSRILNDRISNSGGISEAETVPAAAGPAPSQPALPTKEGSLVTLGGETLVLNRLPLGILVFRDQQVLFANRAITEMTGYDSVEGLRQAGLGAIFPAVSDEAPDAGPVNHLVQRDGTLVPVTARLQSVSWRGRAALMLSASATEVRTGHEAAVRAFAEHLASARAEGFIETARSGALTHISADARIMLRQDESQLLGRPISVLAAADEVDELRAFFERPARFAETTRPAITVKGADPGIEIMLFAQGQAGIISSYFGFLRRIDSPPAIALPASMAPEADPALLARLSRGVRRPLNTVIGFSDLIGTAAFGEIENQRYIEYARDIKTAGLEIAALVDELDDFSRLRDGRYSPKPTDIDLSALLDSAVLRVRGLANRARVLVRSAISERLPHVHADRTSLAQAILNLLASAVDQTPQDGSVVLAAQLDEDGNVVVKIRDSAQNTVDLGERFVVFRDGVGRDGEPLSPVRSSVGLALTRALLSVNGASLAVDPASTTGTLFSLTLPVGKVVTMKELPTGSAE